MDSLGTRMKSYEDNTRLHKGAVIIRVDGKSFHTWTKQARLNRPFDTNMHAAMRYASMETARAMQGFRLAYTQSDETTFCIANIEEMAGAWFDYKLQKLVSITASMFTLFFNSYIKNSGWAPNAFFDARAFSIPVEDAANAFVWRQQDNTRNHIQAKAHSVFSHAAIQNKNGLELVEMLERAGEGIETLPAWIRYGTFVDKAQNLINEPLKYAEVNDYLGFEESVDAAS